MINKFLPGDFIATMSDHPPKHLVENAWFGIVISVNASGYNVLFIGHTARNQYTSSGTKQHIHFYDARLSWSWEKVG